MRSPLNITKRRRVAGRASALFAAVVCGHYSCNWAKGAVVTDGTLGRAGPVSGPNYQIGAGLGRVVGSNLFQSFSQFNIAPNETASFAGPASGAPISNVLARVTGTGQSNIDGTLRCAIPGANFYLVSPGGVVFGPNARLDVQGSFAVTTADAVRLGDGHSGVFRATNPASSVLTTAAPAAFGFLQKHPSAVKFATSSNADANGQHHGSTLQVRDGKSLTVIGGDICANDTQFLAPGGAVNIVSLGSPGQVALNGAGPVADIAPRATKLGAVSLDNCLLIADGPSNGTIASGRVFIRAGTLDATDATEFSSVNYGAATGGEIKIDVASKFNLEDSNLLTESRRSGAGGNITVAAKSLIVSNHANIETDSTGQGGTPGNINVNANVISIDGGGLEKANPTGLFTDGHGSGSAKGGSINIQSRSLSVFDEGEINAGTYGRSTGGDVVIHSKRIVLNGGGLSTVDFNPTSITANAEVGSTGPAGNVLINADSLHVLNTAYIGAETRGKGGGGQVQIEASSILLSGVGPDTEASPFTGISVGTANTSVANGTVVTTSANGGQISVKADSLRILPGAQISAKTNSQGDGGSISINAGQISLHGGPIHSGGPDVLTGVDALTYDNGTHKGSGTGNGGNISVQAGSLLVSRGAVISSSTEPSQPNPPDQTFLPGTGNPGSVTIAAKGGIVLKSAGEISAQADTSDAGTISLSAGGSVDLYKGIIRTQAGRGGGNINIVTPTRLNMRDGTITTNAGAITVPKPGDGGNINIDPAGVILRGTSKITANAIVGNGGNISINTSVYSIPTAQAVTATGGPAGVSGQISITGSDRGLVNSLARLTAGLGTPVQLQDRCGAAGATGSSFTASVLGAPPPEPGGWVPSLSINATESPAVQQAAAVAAIGDYSTADNLLTAAIVRARDHADRRGLIELLNARGSVNTLAGRFTAAARDLDEARSASTRAGETNALVMILNDQGNLGLARQDCAQARDDFAAALSLLTAGKSTADADGPITALAASIEVNHALASTIAGDVDAASAANTNALSQLSKLPDNSTKAFLLITAGNTARQLAAKSASGQADAARKAFGDALVLARALNDRAAEASAAGYAGSLEESQSHYVLALDLTRKAILAAQQDPYTLYRWEWQRARILEKLGTTDDGLAARRRAVAALSPAVRGGLSQVGGNRADPFTFRKDVGPLLFETADLLLKKAAAESDLPRQQPLLAEARDVIELLKGAQVQEYLNEPCVPPQRPIGALAGRTAVIYLVPLPDRTELLVELSDGLHQFTARVSSCKLEEEVRQMRRNLEEGRGTNVYRRPAGQIYEQLVAPLEPLLAAHHTETLVFVPDGALRTIPMAALCYGPNFEHFLIEKYAVAVSPGLRLMDHKVDGRPGATLLAGLSEASPGFPALNYVPQELGAVNQLYPGRVLLDSSFRLETLRESLVGDATTGMFSVVHLATHGKFGRNADETFLLTYHGKITLGDLQAMIAPSRTSTHPVELLTLSACETAAGDDQAALGLAGVAVKSGARTAVATLWCVSDDASAQLIKVFYTAMRDDPALSKAQAMRKAQLYLCNDPRYKHPFYWSPYLVIGNWL